MTIAEYNPFQGRRPIKFHVTFNLLQPLSHISETTGNESLMKTTQMTSIDGHSVQVPVYSGNAQRNGNMGRRTGMASYLEALSITVNKSTHQTLYSGGYIDGGTINDFDAEERIRRLIPLFSLLGGAIPSETMGIPKGKSQMMEGRLNIGDAYLVCYESVPYLYSQCPALLPWEANDSVELLMQLRKQFIALRYQYADNKVSRSSVDEAFAALKAAEAEHLPIIKHYCRPSSKYWEYRESVRVPSFKQTELARHLSAAKPELLKGTKAKKEDGKPEKKEAGRQMISGAWTIQRGSQLYAFWSTRGQGITPVEEGALVNMLLEFAKNPYIGGKGNNGCGLVSVSVRYESAGESGHYLDLSESSQVISDRAADCYERYQEVMDVYKEHVAELKAGKTSEATDAMNLLGVS